ncbi:MAG: hypothetical protein WB677_01160, partial [Xanthobacteraceae bacterium]
VEFGKRPRLLVVDQPADLELVLVGIDLGRSLIVDGPIVHKADGERAARDGPSHAFAEMQRGTAFQRRINGVAVDIAHRGRRFVARIGHARRSDHLAVALEGEAYRVLHAVTRLIPRWRHPAGAQRGKHLADRIEPMVVRCCVCISTAFIYISAAFVGIATAFGRRIVVIGRDDGET